MDDESLDEIKEEALYSVYFDRNEDYYFRCLEKVRRGVIIDFNFYAFIANVFWLSYRKMYWEFAIISLIIPPTPVAAPWNGATADGWLWLHS